MLAYLRQETSCGTAAVKIVLVGESGVTARDVWKFFKQSVQLRIKYSSHVPTDAVRSLIALPCASTAAFNRLAKGRWLRACCGLLERTLQNAVARQFFG